MRQKAERGNQGAATRCTELRSRRRGSPGSLQHLRFQKEKRESRKEGSCGAPQVRQEAAPQKTEDLPQKWNEEPGAGREGAQPWVEGEVPSPPSSAPWTIIPQVTHPPVSVGRMPGGRKHGGSSPHLFLPASSSSSLSSREGLSLEGLLQCMPHPRRPSQRNPSSAPAPEGLSPAAPQQEARWSSLLSASAGLLVLPLQTPQTWPPPSTCPVPPPKPGTRQVLDHMAPDKVALSSGIQATCSLALQLFRKENKQDFGLPRGPSARDPENQTLCCFTSH